MNFTNFFIFYIIKVYCFNLIPDLINWIGFRFIFYLINLIRTLPSLFVLFIFNMDVSTHLIFYFTDDFFPVWTINPTTIISMFVLYEFKRECFFFPLSITFLAKSWDSSEYFTHWTVTFNIIHFITFCFITLIRSFPNNCQVKDINFIT